MLRFAERFWKFQWAGADDELAQYRSMYFLLLSTKAWVVPFLPPFFRELHISGLRVGILQATMPAMSLLFQPLIGSLADASGYHAAIHASSVFLGSTIRSTVVLVNGNFPSLLAVMVIANFFNAPALPFTDSASNSKIERMNEAGSAGWGGVRVFGAVSWALFSPISGMVQTLAPSEGTRAYFNFGAHALFGFITGFNALALEHDNSRSRSTLPTGTDNGASSILREVAHACSSADAIVHILCFMVISINMGFVDCFLFPFLRREDGTEALMGFALTFTCISEIIVFMKAQQMRKALGSYLTLHLCLFAYVLRLGYYIVLPKMGSAQWVLPAQLLHGISFGLYFYAGVQRFKEMNTKSDGRSRGIMTALQGTFSALNNFGHLIGMVLGGALYEYFSPEIMWSVGVSLAAIAMAVLALYQLIGKPGKSEEQAAKLKRTKSEQSAANVGNGEEADAEEQSLLSAEKGGGSVELQEKMQEHGER